MNAPAHEHDAILRRLEDRDVLACAGALSGHTESARAALRCAHRFLADEVLPHAREEDARTGRPGCARTDPGLGSAMRHEHEAIAGLADELRDLADAAVLTDEGRREGRRLVVAMEALVRIHMRREAGLCRLDHRGMEHACSGSPRAMSQAPTGSLPGSHASSPPTQASAPVRPAGR